MKSEELLKPLQSCFQACNLFGAESSFQRSAQRPETAVGCLWINAQSLDNVQELTAHGAAVGGNLLDRSNVRSDRLDMCISECDCCKRSAGWWTGLTVAKFRVQLAVRRARFIHNRVATTRSNSCPMHNIYDYRLYSAGRRNWCLGYTSGGRR